jgi:hypothetical protein
MSQLKLIKNEQKVNYESWMNTHVNKIDSSCESGVHDKSHIIKILYVGFFVCK